MKLPAFAAEQWMTRYEHQAKYNLTDSSIEPLSLKELLDLAGTDLDELVLDYGTIDGDKRLKEQILSLYSSGTAENVTTAAGCLHANEMVMRVLLEKGDHVIAFTPGYQQFYEIPKSLQADVTLLPYHEENHWNIDLKEIKKALRPETKLVIINNPSNPTGSLLGVSEMKDLAELCRQNGTWILCDEVYRGQDTNKYPAISDVYEKGISTGSVSKMFSLAGLRLGWIKAEKSLIDQINLYRDYTFITTGVLDEALAAAALRHRDQIIGRASEIIEKNKDTLSKWLVQNPAFSVEIPETGSVSFMKYDLDLDSETFCRRLLLETGVFLVPGSCFEYEYHFRLCLGQDPEKFKKGLYVLGEWAKRLL